MEPAEELEFCRLLLSDARTAIIQGRTPDAKAAMEEAKQHFFRVYWPLHGRPFTSAYACVSYPGDAMNPPLEPIIHIQV